MRDAIAYLPSLACIAVAGWIAVARGPDAGGWGWFLLVGVLILPTWWTPGGPRH